MSLDTAANYMKLAEYAAANPDAVVSGKTVVDVYRELGIKKDFPNQFGKSLPTATYSVDLPQRHPGPVMTTALWETYLRGRMTEDVADARIGAIEAMFPDDSEATRRLLREEQDIVDDWREEAQKAKRAKQPEPPLPPAPAHYLPATQAAPAATPSAVAVAPAPATKAPAKASARASTTTPSVLPADLANAEAVFTEARRLGQVDAADSAPRSEAELWQALAAFAGHKIPLGPRPALRTAYLDARTLAQRPAPVIYPGLFNESPLAGLPVGGSAAVPGQAPPPAPAAKDQEGDRAEEVDEEAPRQPVHVRDHLLQEFEDEIAALRGEAETLRKERDQALRDSELAAKAHAQALKTMESMERDAAALRAKLEAAEARLTERGQQLHAQSQDGAALLRRAERAEEERDAARAEAERLRQELAERGALPAGYVYCEDDCSEQIARPPGGGLALCLAHQPKDLPPRRPAGVLGLPLAGQHLGGAPGVPTGTWSELGASWARWYLQHTSPADRARQGYDAHGLALYCAERLLQYELEWDELRPAEQAALCRGIEQGLTDNARPPAATPAQGTLLIEREPAEPVPALCGATAPSGGHQGPRCCRRSRGHTGKHCYVEVPHGQRLEEVAQASA